MAMLTSQTFFYSLQRGAFAHDLLNPELIKSNLVRSRRIQGELRQRSKSHKAVGSPHQ